MNSITQNTEGQTLSHYQVAPNSDIARVFLAFLATAGLFYVNIMPALVDGLIQGLNFSNKEAGLVNSANVYGAAVGAFSAVFLVKRLHWRKAAYVLLATLISIDVVSIFLTTPESLMIVRFVHGLVGGVLVGIGFAVMARTDYPDRAFGYLLLVQFGLGGFGVMLLPQLVPTFGIAALYLSLVAFSVVTLLMVPFLADYPIKVPDELAIPAAVNWKMLSLALLATFLFQAANMGLYAYVIGLGKEAGLSIDFISPTLGAAAWIGILGSIGVILLSTRFGRLKPLLISIALTAIATALLHYAQVKWLFIVANCLVGMTWAFAISYLLGLNAAFDKTGQTAALGGFASKMGLASGPAIAALVIGDNHYDVVINIAVFGLVLCALVAFVPTARLDRAQ
ncbi:MFS transporter [Aestuariibacter halophilus]|uniref:MFS transporter n=1 Tax=Fluctibacter halophilus TaxID=226011 RepID=A0ABS8G265_9ALTE|nr:MFS transporter [Aestuariibacter halophilus]MCC2614669.1 MFS transporter [Aestuariibacter halophilus]